MQLFLSLFSHVGPLGILLGIGWFAKKKWDIHPQTISKLLIFCVTPGVLFNAGWDAPIQVKFLILPVVFFVLEAIVSCFFFVAGALVFKDKTRNLFAFSATDPNTGYFGYPVVTSLLGAELGPLTILTNMGSLLYQNLIGYYFLARGHYEVRESLKRLIKLPALYAYGLGLLVQFLHVPKPDFVTLLVPYFTGTWIFLGMAIVGIGLASVKLKELDWKFLSLAFMGKFVLMPVASLLLFWIDAHSTQLFTHDTQAVFWILMLCPTAANTVAYSTDLNVHPEKAASMVFLSTLFALVYIPLVLTLFPL